ncbi:MAG: PD-(D/E)XK nuclease family protein [Treponema sp.]|nr:PD-(D/E)XK nuclease family protein [Treponema sp.]
MSLELFLSQISSINKKYREIYRFSGENFNIFNLLNLSADEISHSKIIATLLNPGGMHENGNKFLRLFLECIEISDFSIDNVITETEKFIGFVSEDYKSGGRIDITLTNNKNQQIFIENKIYANDQWNQLLRYNKYNPKAHLLYLTLFGSEPSEGSFGQEKPEYKKISYKEHIINWLELCKKESINNPLLRETLTQYIILVKHLTGQEREKEMQKEYLDVILKDVENISAAFVVFQNFNDMKLQILKDKFVPLISDLAKRLNLEIDLSLDGCFSSYWGFSLFKQEWKNFKIDFEFEGSNLQNLYYGCCGTGMSKELDEYLRGLNYRKTKPWPLYQYMDQYRYWNKDFYLDLYSNTHNITNAFECKIKEMLLIAENWDGVL